MNNYERAKQFMPFSPLNGLEETLAAQERVREERVYLGEDAQQELNSKLLELEPGDWVTVEFYRGGRYARESGVLKKVDVNTRRLILDEIRIPIDDLKEIYRG